MSHFKLQPGLIIEEVRIFLELIISTCFSLSSQQSVNRLPPQLPQEVPEGKVHSAQRLSAQQRGRKGGSQSTQRQTSPDDYHSNGGPVLNAPN